MNRITRPLILPHNGKAIAIIHEPAEFFETERRRKALVQGILTEGEESGTFPAVRRLGKMFAAERCKSATRRILQNLAKIEGNKHRLASSPSHGKGTKGRTLNCNGKSRN
jgi:hypothetical protein